MSDLFLVELKKEQAKKMSEDLDAGFHLKMIQKMEKEEKLFQNSRKE